MSNNQTIVRSEGRAWLIWSLSAIAFGFAFFQRVAPSVMVADLMRDFAVGGALLGYLSALYFYPYVLLQIPLGALLDRLGARVLLTGALVVAAGGSILFGLADSLFTAYLGRILIGTGSAVGFIGSLALAAKWFPPHRFAFLAGLAMLFGMLSGMLGQAPLALFIGSFGWRAGMIAAGFFAMILALAVFAFVRNSPQSTGEKQNKPTTAWRDVWQGLRKAATSGEVWRIAFVAAAMSGPMLTIGGLWGTPYLMSTFELTRPQAAFYVSLMLFGWAIGAPLSGWLSDRIKRRKVFLVGPSLGISACLSLIVWAPQLSLVLTVAALFLTGLFGGSMTASFALVREASPREITGSVTGIVNSMTVASGAILQPLVGLLLDHVWDGAIENGSRIYQPENFRIAFILILAWAFAGFLMALTLRETHARQLSVEG